MKTKKEIKRKAEELAKEFLEGKTDVYDPEEFLAELFQKMAQFVTTKPQTAEQRHFENLKAYHRVAGE